jgi:hypothetical protein
MTVKVMAERRILDPAAQRRFRIAWNWGVSIEDLQERFGMTKAQVMSASAKYGCNRRIGEKGSAKPKREQPRPSA